MPCRGITIVYTTGRESYDGYIANMFTHIDYIDRNGQFILFTPFVLDDGHKIKDNG